MGFIALGKDKIKLNTFQTDIGEKMCNIEDNLEYIKENHLSMLFCIRVNNEKDIKETIHLINKDGYIVELSKKENIYVLMHLYKLDDGKFALINLMNTEFVPMNILENFIKKGKCTIIF